MISIAPHLALMMVIGIPVLVVPMGLLGRKLQSVSRQSQDRIADVGTIASETLGAMKIVQAFGQEKREAERFRTAVESTFATARRRITLRAGMTMAFMALIFSAIALLMWQGAQDVHDGKMSGGDIAAFVLIGGLVAGAFGALMEVYGDLVRGSAAAGRLAELLTERPVIAAPANPVALPQPVIGSISFEHVQFRYPTRPEVSALADFSLDVMPGETVAVVGPSGAGKSTLFQLVQRFYDPEAGVVRVDGVALPTADPAHVRARIAMVPQETVIFASSARDNLRYGHWEATDDALWAAADAANASEFLKKLPDGLDTFMGEGGARLSGGQRQRMAIARALLRDAPILLLDEATSALDAESERLVQDALERLMQGRTTIVIAHRLATVRSADRIIVMNEGRIVEEGKHDVLVSQKGLYARLAQLQFDG
jgi:ATP-binding cassette subfamily B protein